jgi:predicted nucleic acid-binding protein
VAGPVICLDTNYLIRGLIAGSREASALTAWVRDGETLVAPSIVWYEFLCGPVTPMQVCTMRAFLRDVVAFDDAQALTAAELFNATGRKRALRVDAMIAATAMVLDATLATSNHEDFAEFAPSGLRLQEA